MVRNEGHSSITSASDAGNLTLTTPNKLTSNTGRKCTVGRSRRRRPAIAEAASTAGVDEIDEKENNRQRLRGRRKAKANTNAKTTPIKNRNTDWSYSDYYRDDDGFDSLEKRKKSLSFNSSYTCSSTVTVDTAARDEFQNQNDGRIYEACCGDFRRSLKITSASSNLNLWKDFPDLADTLVRISLSRSVTADSLGLDNHISTLLNFCRTLIKNAAAAATGAAKYDGTVSPGDNLFVAVHVLRSVSFVMADTATIERRESVLKLFYHLINTTSDIEGSDDCMDLNKDNEERCKWIALAGYEGLAEALSHYTITQKHGEEQQQKQKRVVSFRLIRNGSRNDDSADKRIFFAIPSTARRKKTAPKMQSIGNMTVRQLSTIALKTTMVIAKAILHLDPSHGGSRWASYGGLASILLEDANNENKSENRRHHFHRVASGILRHVHGPWLSLLASESITERDAIKEVMSYSKTVHRLLWDAASTNKSRCSTSSSSDRNSTGIERECLELRKQAIVHLLPCTGISKLDSLIRTTFFENACTYAWKAGTVFFQYLSSLKMDSPADESFLFQFYTDLDSVFTRWKGMVVLVPLGFVEYSACKYLHLGSLSASTASTDYPNSTSPDIDEIIIDDEEISSGNYRVLLHVVELGNASKTKIEAFSSYNKDSYLTVPEEIEKRATFATMSFLDELAGAFNRQITDKLETLPSDVLNRVLKVLCNMSLHRSLFLWTKQYDSENLTLESCIPENELFVASTILTECIGPFISTFVNHYPQKAPQLFDLMLECFLRPLSFYEKMLFLRQTEDVEYNYSSFQSIFDSSTALCKRLSGILTDRSQRPDNLMIPMNCIEKAAKSMYLIAKERNEKFRKAESLPPLLFSIKLYDRLDFFNGHNKDYSLSSRLFLLSNSFQSVDSLSESFFVFCMVIDHESAKACSGTTSIEPNEQNLLNHFGAKSCGLLPPSTGEIAILPQMTRSLCRRMASNLVNAEKRKGKGRSEIAQADNAPVDWVIESFLAESTATTSASTFLHPIDSIALLLDFDNVFDNGRRLMHVCSALEILVQFGLSLQQLSREPEVDEMHVENALHNYTVLHELLLQAIADLGLECSRVLHGLLGLIASANLVSGAKIGLGSDSFSSECENELNPLLVDAATIIVDESLKQLELSVDFSDEMTWEILSESVRLALRNLFVVLRRNTTKTYDFDDLLTDCVSVARITVDSETASDPRSVCWTIWTVTILQNELEATGDQEKAAILSLWTMALADKIELYQPWFQASALTACAKENNLLYLNYPVVLNSFDASAPIGSTLWIFEKEFRLCNLRTEAFKSGARDQKSFHIQMQKLEVVRTALEKHMVAKDDNLFLLYTWVLSTVYLVQSDVSMMFGCYSTALKTAQRCQKCCQAIIKNNFRFTSDDNWITAIATSTVLARASQRYIEMLSRRPKLHCRLGDHRKALAYMRCILEYSGIDPDSLTSNESKEIPLKDLNIPLNVGPQIRLFLQMKSWASTPDTMLRELSRLEPKDLTRHPVNNARETNFSIVQSIQYIIAVGDIFYGDSISIGFQQNFTSFYEEAVALMVEKATSIKEHPLNVPSNVDQRLGMPIFEQVKLRDVRRLLVCSLESDMDSGVSIRKLSNQVAESEFSSSKDKAWSLYYLGVLELESARQSGALQEMWNDHECDENSYCEEPEDEHLRAARLYLSRASLHTTSISDVFTRNVLRSQALAEGPRINHSIGKSAAILILKSVGQSIRRKLACHFNQDYGGKQREYLQNLQDIFSIFDAVHETDRESDDKIAHFFEELAAQTPDHWGYVAPVICPTGEMLVVIIQKTCPNSRKFSISTKCVFSPRGENAYDNIMKPLDSVLGRVQEQLNGVNPELISSSDDKESMKRKWWNERNQLDAEMSDLLEYVESLYFTTVFNHDSSTGLLDPSTTRNDIEEFPCGNLSSRFEAACDDDNNDTCDPEKEHQDKVEVLSKLTVPKLKDRLLEAGADKSQFRKLRKMDIIELLIQIEQGSSKSEKVQSETKLQHGGESETSNSCLFLILDENLHRFPFEGMPVLKGKTICRVPCLSFVLATMREFAVASDTLPSVDPYKATYIVDPEKNLYATQKRILPALESLTLSNNWGWDGVVGEIPPTSFFEAGLSKKYGIMMYFGHGGAQVCFSRRRVEELIDGRASSLCDQSGTAHSCRATVLLMGCSSGKLTSINRKNSNSVEQAPLYYEPEGVALSYLCAGAPCVVGNLWDVTDNDIDRFSISLLQHFFDDSTTNNENKTSTSLAESVSIARSACKLQHLVGCAPVCYGVPVYLRRTAG